MKKLILISVCMLAVFCVFRYVETSELVWTCPEYETQYYSLAVKVDENYIKSSIILAPNERKEEGVSYEENHWWSFGNKDREAILEFRKSIVDKNYAWLVENYPNTFSTISKVKEYIDFFEDELSKQNHSYEVSLCSISHRIYFFGPKNRSFHVVNNSGGSSSISVQSDLKQAAARIYLSYENSEKLEGRPSILNGLSSVYIDPEYPGFGSLYFESEKIVVPFEISSKNISDAVNVYTSSVNALLEGQVELFLDGYTQANYERIVRWFEFQKDISLPQTLSVLKDRKLIGAIDGGPVVLLFFKFSGNVDYEYLVDVGDGQGYKLANFQKESLIDGFFRRNLMAIKYLYK